MGMLVFSLVTASQYHLQQALIYRTPNWYSPGISTSSYPASLAALPPICTDTEQCIHRSTPTVPVGTSGTMTTILKLFSIPHAWWPAFLHGAKMPHNTLHFITSITKCWKTDIRCEAASRACLWARSICTADERDPKLSTLAIHINVDEGDTKTICWATQHLQGYLPIPSTTKPTPPLLIQTTPPATIQCS